MTKTHHNKLVRDHIPEIIRADNRNYDIETLSDMDYEQGLRDKLIEEATEVAEVADDELLKELADLQEVIHALMRLKNITPEALQTGQKKRREQRGGFEKRIYLLWTE